MKKGPRAGIVRNKFQLLLEIKEKSKRKQSRFAKKTNQRTSVSLSQSTSMNENSLLQKQSGIQLSLLTTLPPEWVDKFEDCQLILKQIDDIKKQISSLHAKRLNTMNSKEEATYDRMIYDKASQATKKITQCDLLLRQIRANISQNSPDGQVCKNLSASLAQLIQQKAKQLRGQQRAYIQQRKRLQNSTKVSFLDVAVENVLGGEMYEDDLQMMEIQSMQMQERNKQILKLVDTINQLNEVYKQMSSLVLVQGTLLDRIDVNLDTAIQHVKEANKNLTEVIKRQSSPFAKRCIMIMIVFVVLLGLTLILKHSR